MSSPSFAPWWSTAVSACVDLVFPRHCFLCHRRYSWLCDDCTTGLRASGPLIRTVPVHGAPALSVVSATEGTTSMLTVLTAYKDESWGVLAPHIAELVCAHMPRDGEGSYDVRAPRDGSRRPVDARAWVVGESTFYVPVPQTRAAFRRRGWHPLPTLVRRMGRRPTPALRFVRQPEEQSRLGRVQRHDNVAGSMCARDGVLPRGSWVVLVDDIVTTGSTLAEAARALYAYGVAGVEAVTVASVPRQ